jgi:hypothetical protein
MDIVGILNGHLVYFTPIWPFLWPFGIFYGHLVYFSRFGMFVPKKSGNPDVDHFCFSV